MTQPVMIQSFQDEFDTGRTKQVRPAEAGTVLQKARANEEQSNEEDQTKYRSGVGKMMRMMRWTRPGIYNAVRDCARHMQGTTEDHYQSMGHKTNNLSRSQTSRSPSWLQNLSRLVNLTEFGFGSKQQLILEMGFKNEGFP